MHDTAEILLAPTESQLVTIGKRFRRHKLATFSSCVLIILYAVAIFAPQIAPYDYAEVNPGNFFHPPSREHLMGTDRLGRDVFSRIVYGSRISLSVGFLSSGLAVLIGVFIGALAGYFGGRLDDVLMRLTEVVMAFPVFFLLLTVAALFPSRSIFTIMIIIGLTAWPSLARIVRAQMLSLRSLDFTEAARALGASDARIIFRHLVPNCLAPVIVSATLRVGSAILTESGLSFLGLGPQGVPSWGMVLNQGRSYIRLAPWITMWPGIFIFITVLAFNYVGDGLRDALDPKLKQ